MASAAPLPQIRDQARGRWRAILPRLGVPASFLDGKQHACPQCGGKDRARFDDLEGNGTWFCNQCGAGDGMKLVMGVAGLRFADAAARVREVLPDTPIAKVKPPRDDERCAAALREVWSRSVPIAGTMAEAYLRHRGCWSDAVSRMGSLRFVERLRATKHEAGYLPALIARVSDATGAGVNIHRTFLVDGRKAYRAMMPGPVPPGAAIRLWSAAECMGVAEGIETALHAGARFGVACWAAITAGGIERWEPPQGTRHVTICGDTDASYTGQAAAYILARKLTNRREPIACDVRLPDEMGTDWADVGAGRIREACVARG